MLKASSTWQLVSTLFLFFYYFILCKEAQWFRRNSLFCYWSSTLSDSRGRWISQCYDWCAWCSCTRDWKPRWIQPQKNRKKKKNPKNDCCQCTSNDDYHLWLYSWKHCYISCSRWRNEADEKRKIKLLERPDTYTNSVYHSTFHVYRAGKKWSFIQSQKAPCYGKRIK